MDGDFMECKTRTESFGEIEYLPDRDKFFLKTDKNIRELAEEKLSAPLTAHWITTMKCNARCPYCYELSSLLKPKAEEKILSEKEITKFIDDFASAGGFRFYLTGGEPTLNPNLPFIIRESYNHQIKCVINSNGIELPENVYCAIKECNSRLSLSLDSYEKEVHNSARRQKSFDNIVSVLKRAGENNLDVRIISVLQNKNPEYWINFGEFLTKLKVKNWFVQGLCSDADELTGLELVLKEKFPDMKIRVLPAIYESFFYIMPNGDVASKLWTAEKKIHGNVAEENVKLIWNRFPYNTVKDYGGILNLK
jgi:MoaA/NifB/PqqE/SkfB family radical SAM enzyme